MNQCLYRSLAAAVVMSAVSVPFPAAAEQINQLEASLQASGDLETSSEPFNNSSLGNQVIKLDEAEKTASTSQEEAEQTASTFQEEEVALGLSDTVQVIPHALDENQAATVYVNNIPVLTFVGAAVDSLAGKENEAEIVPSEATSSSPEYRAEEVAYRLDQFHQSEGDPETISARWDADLEEYVIGLADERLVIINETTILPDTTNNFAEDTLQATNRLRRLLGGAEPLQAVEGRPEPIPGAPAYGNWDVSSVATGRASWYGPGFHGRRTASGEVFNQNAMTAAHRTLPFGTLVRVTNLNTNQQVIVRINDRGPFSHGRILDLSAGAARQIGLASAGVGSVRLEVLSD
ncbi:MAG: septal ring lytic transglycosylase RlpA family protein [Leptolyngbya sp. SIO1D8]|nr:septal ring lytic transglycosylase RlpA family protein [Leptolyngbya sp. SIO1D8]